MAGQGRAKGSREGYRAEQDAGCLVMLIWLISVVGGLSVLTGYSWLLIGAGNQPITGPVALGVGGFVLSVVGLALWCLVPRR